jgi:hypothetical protein
MGTWCLLGSENALKCNRATALWRVLSAGCFQASLKLLRCCCHLGVTSTLLGGSFWTTFGITGCVEEATISCTPGFLPLDHCVFIASEMLPHYQRAATNEYLSLLSPQWNLLLLQWEVHLLLISLWRTHGFIMNINPFNKHKLYEGRSVHWFQSALSAVLRKGNEDSKMAARGRKQKASLL